VRKYLLAGHALVHKKPKIDPAVFGSPVRRLVRCCRIFLPHRARRNNILHFKVTFLEQIGDYGLCALLAELLVVIKSASRVGIPSDFDYKSCVSVSLSCKICVAFWEPSERAESPTPKFTVVSPFTYQVARSEKRF
jgi:hypothetical protein